MIELKTEKEIEKMRSAAQIVARTLDLMEEKIEPGISTIRSRFVYRSMRKLFTAFR